MDLKVLSTGKSFFKLDDGVGSLLLEMFPAALQRIHPKPAPAAPVPQWGVSMDAGGYPHIFYKHGGQVERYDGPPDKAIDGFKHRQWNAEQQAHIFDGPTPPASVIEEFRQKCAAAGVEGRATLPARYYAMARQEPEVIK